MIGWLIPVVEGLLAMTAAAVITWRELSAQIYPERGGRSVLYSALIIGIGGPIVFYLVYLVALVPLMLPFALGLGALIGLALGAGAFWVIVAFTIDRFMDLHYDRAHAVTVNIVRITLIAWIVIGGVGMLIS